MAPSGSTSDGAAVAVGPVLARGPVASAVLAALRRSCPDLAVVDRGAYLRVLVPGRCRLVRADVERELGRPFHLPADLEEVMPAFKGALAMSDDEVVWFSREGGG